MPLETYQRKRDFARTPEPAGTVAAGPPAGSRRFVVQRHRATRLHYDFRLEIDGVLMSWAVPRGPSVRPLERRMAARTEDHPLEYFDFEGVIPHGSYGAGDVIVWDWGVWEPEETDDPGEAVRKGELKFVLHGEKLKGRFVLVRTRKDGDKEDWLLIHKRDETADPDWDIDALPRSVKSGRTNDEVKAGAPAVWDSSAPAAEASIDLAGATRAPLPDFVPPMLATAVDKPFSDDDWLYEMKLDGYRVEAVVKDGRVHLWTRNKQDAARYFPDLAEAKPTWINATTAIVDGEVVALNEEGLPDFSLLQDRTGMRGFASKRGERRPRERTRTDEAQDERPKARLAYFLFDLIYLDGQLLVDVPLEERKKLLKISLRDHSVVQYAKHIERDGEDFYAAAGKQGLEGIVAKMRRSRYEPGRRSKTWLKIKIRRDQELVVVGYEPGKGSHADLGALLVALYEGDELRYAGEVGSGLNERIRRTLREQLDGLARPDPPCTGVPAIRGVHWAEPKIVIRAEFSEWTSDNLLRQAAFKGIEVGRDPRTVRRERTVKADEAVAAAERQAIPELGSLGTPVEPAARASKSMARASVAKGRGATAKEQSTAVTLVRSPGDVGDPPEAVTREELDELDAMTGDGLWSIGGVKLKLSNLDKVLFPGAGYTKRDLIRYYVTIAPVLLPYLRDRPLNVDRWPDGVNGHHFWQKQIPSHAPAWVARWDYPEAGKNESHTYVVADRVATLGWLANQAVIDLHPWTSRLPDWSVPTYALIDIDPGEKTTFEQVVILARLYQTALGHLGVKGVPKVTGKRGIQIWVPIAQRYTFDETRDWVAGLSRAVGSTVPDLVSWEWEKAARRGRARLDFTQNAVNKTLVAPYAVRPMPTASVSAPIAWKELDDPGLRPDGWNIQSVLPRVEERGDLFHEALELEQDLPPL
jgi:bifunctional non-homologous end joining protein LigD